MIYTLEKRNKTIDTTVRCVHVFYSRRSLLLLGNEWFSHSYPDRTCVAQLRSVMLFIQVDSSHVSIPWHTTCSRLTTVVIELFTCFSVILQMNLTNLADEKKHEDIMYVHYNFHCIRRKWDICFSWNFKCIVWQLRNK